MKNFLVPVQLCYDATCRSVMVPWVDKLSDVDEDPDIVILSETDGQFTSGLYVRCQSKLVLALDFAELCRLLGKSYQLQLVVGATAPQVFPVNSRVYRNGYLVPGETVEAGASQVWTVGTDPTVTVPPIVNDQLALKAPLESPTFTGTVAGITKSMVGLSLVDNTPDLSKPISTAVATELDSKVDKVVGKGLSTEDYSSVEKAKLAGITAGATANQSDAFLLSRTNHTGTQAMSTVTSLLPSLHGRQVASTALITGGAVTINPSLTSVDIAAGSALFVDYTDPKAPLGTQLDFGPTTSISIVNLATAPATYLGIDGSGTIVQQIVPFTATQRRSIVPLALAIHSNNTTINVVNSIGASSRAALNQLQDLIEALGALNLSGNIYAPQSGLTLQRSAGSIFKYGSNFPANPMDPHKVSLAGETPVTFRYRLQNSGESANTTLVDPSNYDLNGVLTPVPNNRWTIQRVALFQSGLTRIQYGQFSYASYTEAARSMSTESVVIEPNIGANGLIRALLIIQEGATNLADTNQAVFVGVSKFGALFTSGQ